MRVTSKDAALLELGHVPAQVAARWGRVAGSTIHRAVDTAALIGQRVGRRLYVDWADFRTWLGPLAQQLPQTAREALERDP